MNKGWMAKHSRSFVCIVLCIVLAAMAGSTVTKEDVPVAGGLFAVSLDFGADVFAGDARYLAAAVRPGSSTGSYTILSPRQPLAAVPYALYAQNIPDHDHLGETWTGSENPLKIEGSFGEESDDAPLVLSNSGNGNGLYIQSAGHHGVRVGSAGGAGVRVDWAGDDGVFVYQAGSPSANSYSGLKNGFEVASAEGHGLYVGRADQDGVRVESTGSDGVLVVSAGGEGVQVQSSGSYGVYVNSAGSHGVLVQTAGENGMVVGSADGDGVYVWQAGTPSAHNVSSDKNGFEVDGAQGHGLYVGRADLDGVHVHSAGRRAGYFGGDVEITGNLTVTGNLTKPGGSFKIDHPLDPKNKTLSHSFVESPDMMNVYNGNVTTDADGFATVTLPDYFEALNRDYRYQLTVIGTFAQAIVAQEIEANRFVIQTDRPAVKVSWQVTGIRQDPYANANRIVVEQDKPPEERGTCLLPEAYGLPEERGLAYTEMQAHLAQEEQP